MKPLPPVDLRGPDRVPRRGLLTLWVAILAVLATAVFGLVTVGEEAAASEPADAVKRLLRAAGDSDVLGALDAVLPSERAVIREPLLDLVQESERLGLLGDMDLKRVGGVDLDFANVHMTTSTLAPGFAAVRIDGGKVTGSFDPRRFPIGPTLTDAGVDLGDEPQSEVNDIAEVPLELMTVRSDGKWYVSITYSIAEAARKDSGAAAPNFGAGVPARGEATPRAAVEAALRAGLALDVERLLGLVSPGEGRALRDYAPLFLEDVKAAAAEARRSFSVTINSLQVSDGDGGGSERRVVVGAFDIALRFGGETGRIVFDGECTTVTAPGEPPQKACAKDALRAVPFLNALPEGAGLSKLTFNVIEDDGAWFISPTRSITGMLLDTTKLLDRKTLADAIRQFQAGFGGSSESSSSVRGA